MEPGIHYNVSRVEYDKIEAFHFSGIWRLLKSPAHYKYFIEHPEPPSDAMILGNLVDTLLLEPNLYNARYGLLPETYINDDGDEKKWNMNAKVCKEEYAELKASGKQVIKSEMLETANAMIEQIKTHAEIMKTIEESKKQVCVVWVDADTGVMCKALLDMLSPDGTTDLKTTTDASQKAFSFKINSFLYHVQGAMYSDGVTAHSDGIILPYRIIAVETEPPHCPAIYALEENSLLTGREIYKHALRIYKDCVDNNSWPGYSQFIEDINIPAYAISKVLEEGVING